MNMMMRCRVLGIVHGRDRGRDEFVMRMATCGGRDGHDLTGYGIDAAFGSNGADVLTFDPKAAAPARRIAQTHAIFCISTVGDRRRSAMPVARASRMSMRTSKVRLRDDFHNAAIVEQQRVVGAKSHGSGKSLDAGASNAEQKSALRLSCATKV